jgi:hypothetical protein
VLPIVLPNSYNAYLSALQLLRCAQLLSAPQLIVAILQYNNLNKKSYVSIF